MRGVFREESIPSFEPTGLSWPALRKTSCAGGSTAGFGYLAAITTMLRNTMLITAIVGLWSGGCRLTPRITHIPVTDCGRKCRQPFYTCQDTCAYLDDNAKFTACWDGCRSDHLFCEVDCLGSLEKVKSVFTEPQKWDMYGPTPTPRYPELPPQMLRP